MSKSYVLFSLALGGLVLAGCNKDETPATPPASPATAPSATPTTSPSTPETTPASAPATGPAASLNSANAVVAGAEKKAEEGVGAALKSAPTTSPITDANK